MPSVAFQSAMPFILRWEGGFVDHPKDPGGRTNKGITQRTYDAWRTRNGLARQDVKAITSAEVHSVYEAGYWLPPRCNDLPPKLDLVQFDTAVNMGVGRAVRFLQGAVGCSVDGQFGAGTAKSVAGCNPQTALESYCDRREAFYRRLTVVNPDLKVFLKGWLNRLNALRQQVGLIPADFEISFDPSDDAPAMRIPDLGEDPKFDI